jgi:T5SS/PEP-CTERM-associated repeat protein
MNTLRGRFPLGDMASIAFFLVPIFAAHCDISVGTTTAQMRAHVVVQDAPSDVPIEDDDNPEPESGWQTYTRSIDAHAAQNGGVVSVTGDLNAQVNVNGNNLSIIGAGTLKNTFTSSPPFTARGRSGTSGGASAEIMFSVTEASNFSLSGALRCDKPGAGFAQVRLTGANGIIRDFVLQNPTEPVNQPISATGTLVPGNYALVFRLGGSIDLVPGSITVSGNLQFDVIGAAPNVLHWINPTVGDYDDASNWVPAQVPGPSDTAVFDVVGAAPITVIVPSASVAHLLVSKMNLVWNGPGSVTSASSPFGFGVEGGGKFTLANGSMLFTEDAVIGGPVGSSASEVVVTGAGSRVMVAAAGEVDVGKRGPGSLLIEKGGLVDAGNLVVGDKTNGAIGIVRIAGASSRFSLHSGVTHPTLNVAGAPGTQLEVADGGVLLAGTAPDALAADVIVGDATNTGKVWVHGTGAAWDLFGLLRIGSGFVASELIVEDGGHVTNQSSSFGMILGFDLNQTGRVTVSGNGSVLSMAGATSIGARGHGALFINDGGFVESEKAAVGTLTFPDTGNGTGVVTIKGSPFAKSEWKIAGDCSVGAGEPGTIALHGASIGPLSVGGATVRVGGKLEVESKGFILGTGTLAAANRVVNGGAIAPGLSPGVIVIEGDYEQLASGVLRMQAAGLNTGDFDVLHVTGKSTLGGTMELTFLDGYLPQAGDTLPFLALDGEISGSFSQITFPGLEPGFAVKTEMVNGRYQVTAVNNAVPLSPKGSFRGLLRADPSAHEAAGFFTIRTTATGGFSSRVMLGGRSFGLNGKFDAAGKFTRTIPRKGDSPLVINLELSIVDGVRVIKGTLADENRTIPISAERANVFNAQNNPAPQAGNYTALLQFDPTASDTPRANGIGLAKVSKSGAIRFVGRLSDGAHLSQGTMLSKGGEWPLYVLLYDGEGSLFGNLQFRDQLESDFDGTLQWSRPQTARDKTQTAGFFTALSTVGSRYLPPPVQPSVLIMPSGATASLEDLELAPPLIKNLTLTSTNKFVVTDSAADKFSLQVRTADGLLSAAFVHPNTLRSTKARGVIFQKQNRGSGFFLRPGLIGSVEIQPRS